MIDPSVCKGCFHWRTVGWKYPKASLRNRACHYMLDTGKSRLKNGDTEKCSVRCEKANNEPEYFVRVARHKFDFKQSDLEKAKKGGVPLSFDRDKAMELISAGKTDEEVANELGVKYRTIQCWRNRHGIKGNRKRGWKWKKKEVTESA